MKADANLQQYAAALADALDAAVPGWIVRSIEGRWHEWRGAEPLPDDLLAAARTAAEAARADVGAGVRALFALDVDAQQTNPLAVVRTAVSHATAVLRAAGVPEVVRDDFAERAFPDDVYDLAPASFAEIDQSLYEPGLEWGAAKAHAHLTRRKRRR